MAAKDELIDLLQDRFADLEMDVPPGAWEAISGQLAQAAAAEGFQQALQEKFQGHETDVDPGVWQQISSQLGHGAAAGAVTGTTGWFAAGAAAVLITGGLWVWNATADEKPNVAPAPLVEQVRVVEAPQEALPEAKEPPTAVVVAPVVRSAVVPVERSAAPVDTQGPGSAPVDPEGLAMVEKILRDLERMTSVTQPAGEGADVPGGVPTPDPKAGQVPDPVTRSDNDPGTPEPLEQARPKAKAPEPIFHIPNVFTPKNADGVNDKLVVSGLEYEQVLVRIFSARDNTLVFQASDLEHSWDARLPNGQPAEDGMYFYAIEVLGTDGKAYTKGQVVHLNPPGR